MRLIYDPKLQDIIDEKKAKNEDTTVEETLVAIYLALNSGNLDDVNVSLSNLYANPAGTIQLYGAATAPTGWMICDGTAISRSTYSKLYNIIGTSYGVGDGTTTFNLPNLKGKVPVGRNSADGDFDTLGETGGAKTVAHTHTTADHTHSGTTGSTTAEQKYLDDGSAWVGNTANHTHPFTTGGASAGNTTSGASDANNLQPYQVFNYIIKT